jgi:hypothetical protein
LVEVEGLLELGDVVEVGRLLGKLLGIYPNGQGGVDGDGLAVGEEIRPYLLGQLSQQRAQIAESLLAGSIVPEEIGQFFPLVRGGVEGEVDEE